ncbi:MAG: enoyl-CoA hydratase/isomerase family protein [Proteobacteria bacterium]|nr:enoyl-CoA hydratase/isomerase family protein [Pseudomonadota bacterium]
MDYRNIIYEVKDKVGYLTVNRPKRLNALNVEALQEIGDALAGAKSDEQVRVIVLTGAGDKAFVAGADITEFEGVGLKEGYDFARRGQKLTQDLEGLGKPSIAAVNGLALGGGCELALACTFRILSETAKMGLPELGLGVIPGYGGTQRLSRVIGKSRALWAMMTGDMIGAQEALQIGLANMVVKPEELMDATAKVANKIVGKAPLAVKMALIAVNQGVENDLETGLVLEAAFGNLLLVSEDKEEGVRAFMEKRKPNFTGK